MIPELKDARTCAGKRCGRKVYWIEVQEEGPRQLFKKVCVDAIAAVYEVVEYVPGRGLLGVRRKDCFVNHFLNCPDRDEFRKKK